jgi:hypothetical protein
LECLRLLATLPFAAQAARLPDEQEKRGAMEIVTSWMEKGLAKGRQEGRQEGRQQGMLQRAREDILDVLEARFAAVPWPTTERLLDVQDLVVLKTLLRRASTVPSAEAFLENLPPHRQGY